MMNLSFGTSAVVALPHIDKPVITFGTLAPGIVPFSWNVPANSGNYLVYRSLTDRIGDAVQIYNGPLTSFSDNTVGSVIHYWYFVIARGFDAISSTPAVNDTTSLTLGTLTTPGVYFSNVYSSGYTAYTFAVANATSYWFYENTVNNFGTATLVGNSATLSYNRTGKTIGQTYYVWCIAKGVGYTDSTSGTGNLVTAGASIVENTPFFGDSITVGQGATTPYPLLLASARQIATIRNLAIGSTGIRKQAQLALCDVNGIPFPVVTPAFTQVGFNNIRVLTGQAVRYEHVNAGHRAIAAIQFCKSIWYPRDGPNGSLIYNGTWSNPYVTGNGAPSTAVSLDVGSRSYYARTNLTANFYADYFYRSSVIANETYTFTVATLANEGISIGTRVCDGTTINMSRIEVKVDGTVVKTYDPNFKFGVSLAAESFTTNNISADAIILPNQTAGSHTVILTFLDGTKPTFIDYYAVLKSAANSTQIPLYVNDMPHALEGSAGNGVDTAGLQTTNAIIDAGNASRKADLQANFPGYEIIFVPINATTTNVADGYNAQDTTQVNTDGVHPRDHGHVGIANADLAVMAAKVPTMNAIVVSEGILTPPFNPAVYNYTLSAFNNPTVTLQLDGPTSTGVVNGVDQTLAGVSAPVNISGGSGAMSIYIRSASGINSAVYNIAITKAGSAVISALAIAAATNVTDNNGILFGSSAPTGWDGKVLFTKKLALGTDGHIMQQYMGGAHDTIITFKENNLSEVYTANTYKAGLQISSATPHYVFNNGTYTTTSITFALYDYLRIKVVGTAITVEKSSNGTSWTTVYTFAYTRTTDLYIGMSVYGVSKVYGAKGFNLI